MWKIQWFYQLLCGGTFFAIPYIGLSIGLVPSLIIGAGAYGASELIFHNKNSQQIKDIDRNLYDIFQEAKEKNNEILKISEKIDKPEVVKQIKEITSSVTKIIATIEKEPKKYKKMNNFFEYYLPTTLNIIKKYDEIENQSLTSDEGKKFMLSTEKMIEKVNNSFKSQLSKLYQSDMIDTDAEMKVFNNMLNADGYSNENDLNIYDERGKQSWGKNKL